MGLVVAFSSLASSFREMFHHSFSACTFFFFSSRDSVIIITYPLTTRVIGAPQMLSLIHISYKNHVTNKEVHARIQEAIGPHKDLTILKRRKLQWYGHVSCSLDLAKTIWQCTVKGRRRQGRQRKRWEDKGMDRPEVWQFQEGSGEQGKMEKTGCEIICGAPMTLVVKG